MITMFLWTHTHEHIHEAGRKALGKPRMGIQDKIGISLSNGFKKALECLVAVSKGHTNHIVAVHDQHIVYIIDIPNTMHLTVHQFSHKDVPAVARQGLEYLMGIGIGLPRLVQCLMARHSGNFTIRGNGQNRTCSIFFLPGLASFVLHKMIAYYQELRSLAEVDTNMKICRIS